MEGYAGEWRSDTLNEVTEQAMLIAGGRSGWVERGWESLSSSSSDTCQPQQGPDQAHGVTAKGQRGRCNLAHREMEDGGKATLRKSGTRLLFNLDHEQQPKCEETNPQGDPGSEEVDRCCRKRWK